MKRWLAFLVTMTMVFQICGAGFTIAEETELPTVTVTYTDETGTEKTIDLSGDDPIVLPDGVSVWDNLPSYGVGADVHEGDTRITLNVDGDISLTNDDSWNSDAVHVGNHVDATVTGNITDGSIQTFNSDKYEYSEETGTSIDTYTPSDSTITVMGDVTAKKMEDGYWINAVTGQGTSQITVNGNVENGAVIGTNQAQITVTGNVTTNGDFAISTDADLLKSTSSKDGDGNYTWTEEQSEIAPVITVNGDVTNTSGSGILAGNRNYNDQYIDNNAVITVGGNLTADDDGIVAQGNSVISVNGSVTAEYRAIEAVNDSNGNYSEKDNGDGTLTKTYEGTVIQNNATISIGGDVTSNQGVAVFAHGNSNITINGNVTGINDGIAVGGAATVKVDGNVESTDGTGIRTNDEETSYTSSSTYAVDEEGNQTEIYSQYTSERTPNTVTVTVGGDVTGKNVGISTVGGSTIEVSGNVISEDGTGIQTRNSSYWDGEKSVQTYNESTITVDGDLTAKYTGINTQGETAIEVGGNVTSEHGNGIQTYNSWEWDGEESIKKENESTVTVGGDVNAYATGVVAYGNSEVTVGGSITAGHSEEVPKQVWDKETQEYVPDESRQVTVYHGNGIEVSDSAAVTVDGSVTAEGTAVSIYDSSNWKTESQENEDGTITYTETKTGELSTATINVGGDVTSNHGNGIYAEGEGTIAVEGSVNAKYDGVSANGKAEVTVGGDVTSTHGDGIYTTAEDIGGTGTWTEGQDDYQFEATETADEAKVVVEGSVTSEARAGINMSGNSQVTVLGDVTGGWMPVEDDEENEYEYENENSARDEARNAAWDEAFKDVEFGYYYDGAIEVRLAEETNDGQLIVGGTIKTNGEDYQVPVVLNYTVTEEEKAAEMPALPEMKIYEISPEGGQYFDVNVQLKKEFEYSYQDETTGETVTEQGSGSAVIAIPEEDHAAMIEAIAQAIQYIIKLNAVNGTINLGNAQYDAENDLYTAHENEAVQVTVRPDDGYELSGLTATGNYTLAQNGDGSWTLTVQRGGGVTVSATINQKYVATTTEKKQSSQGSGKKHPAVGKTIVFGKYDIDKDGTPEDLTWVVMAVSGKYAKLALIPGQEAIPEDFNTAFNEQETAAIKEGTLQAMDQAKAKKRFGDELVHAEMFVLLSAIGY